MTIASSTTKPVAIVRAIRVRLLRLNPHRYIIPKVPTRDNGTAMLGMTVAEKVRRNKNITMTTSAIASSISNSTSSTEERIVVVRSVRILTCTAAGSELCSCGNSFLIRSTTSITFEPGCRCMLTITAGESFIQAACLTFSAASIAEATSDNTTGAPLR